MSTKRKSEPTSPNKKRQRVSNNLDIILKYLKDTTHCEVPGPPSCREMLWLAMPRAIGEGAAGDERHDYQLKFGDIIGEVFEKSVETWVENVEKAKKVIKDAEEKQKQKDDEKAAAIKEVEDCKETVKKDKIELHTKEQEEDKAEKKWQAAKHEVANFDKEQAKKKKQLDRDRPVSTEAMAKLKSGDFDGRTAKKYSSQVTVLLRSLRVDKSLFGALTALAKQPADRGHFDVKVVDECVEDLKKHIDELEKEIGDAAEEKKTKDEAVKTAEAALTEATTEKNDAADKLKTAENELKDANQEAKKARKALDDAFDEVGKAVAALEVETDAHEKAVQAQDAWKFLSDRKIKPEPKSPVKLEPKEGEK